MYSEAVGACDEAIVVTYPVPAKPVIMLNTTYEALTRFGKSLNICLFWSVEPLAR